MENILDYIFVEPFPWPWLVQDIIVILLTLFVLAFVIRRAKRPFTCIGGFTEILWIVLLASVVQSGLLLFAYLNSRRLASPPLTAPKRTGPGLL